MNKLLKSTWNYAVFNYAFTSARLARIRSRAFSFSVAKKCYLLTHGRTDSPEPPFQMFRLYSVTTSLVAFEEMQRTWHRGITPAGSFRAQAEAMILCQNLKAACQKSALPDRSDAWTGAFCRCDSQEEKSFKRCDHIATSFRAQAEAMTVGILKKTNFIKVTMITLVTYISARPTRRKIDSSIASTRGR